jgi:hypothetical protein
MTPDQHANRMSLQRPPDRDGAARPATASRVPDYGQNCQIPPAMMVRRPGWPGPSRQFANPNAPMVHRRPKQRHSTPIARAVVRVAA